MAWQFAFRQTYVFNQAVENIRLPILFQPHYRLVIKAVPLAGVGQNDRSLGALSQQLFVGGFGDVKGISLPLVPDYQLLVPSTEFTYRLLYQPLKRSFSFELSIWVDTVPMTSDAGSTDNTPVLAALAAIQASIEALPATGTGTDDTATLAAIQASIAALDLEQSSAVAALLALGTGQTAIATQLTNIQAAMSTPIPAPPPTVPLTFESNGDTNGLFYWLGTFYGQHAWINPQTLGTLTVVISSLAGSGSLSLLTNRVGASTLYSSSAPGQWVAFDLGARKKLQLNYYALQHDNENGYYLRSWKLQGSNAVASNSLTDLANAAWTDLRVHTNDTTLNASDSWGSWDVVTTLGYRWFRLVMTGTDANGSNYLVLGEVEFYGTFTRL